MDYEESSSGEVVRLSRSIPYHKTYVTRSLASAQRVSIRKRIVQSYLVKPWERCRCKDHTEFE